MRTGVHETKGTIKTLVLRIVTINKMCWSSFDFDISFHASKFARSRY